MAVGLFVAASILVTTFGLVVGLTINKPKCLKIKRDGKRDSIELEESERERIKKLFERETGYTSTFDELREFYYTGYTNCYLLDKFDIENLTTTASLEIVIDLVKLDLAEGAKPEEIVFGCCFRWPKREVISAVIEKTGANIKDVLEYEDRNGYNCLIAMFDVLAKHKKTTKKDPTGTEMAIEVEKSVFYLIELGEKQGLEMKPILEKTAKSGQTLLFMATLFSPNLAFELLKREIKAKSIDDTFMTPRFRFKSVHRPMIAAGVNPFVLDHRNDTQADRYNVSKEVITEANPSLTSNLFYSTTSLPCNNTCNESCEQGLPDPWYYNNGLVYNFEDTDKIGGGAEGIVFKGLYHGTKAAFKFVEIKNLKYIKNVSGAIEDLNKRLLEMTKLSETNGQNILPFYGHIRQQLSAEKVVELGLGTEVTRYEVYITKQCDFNLAHLKNQIGVTVDEAKVIIDQLIDAQEQLQAAGVSHNDIKPGNILVDHDPQTGHKIYIGDFGQADQLGGTPGWTAADFVVDRVPGKTDMYSFGLVILFLLCETNELFYALRDNFIPKTHKDDSWYRNFLSRPVIKLVSRMIEVDPQDRINSDDLKKEWIKIRNSTETITIENLNLPDDFDKSLLQGQFEVVMGGKIEPTMAKTAFTQTHLQGDTCFCWLYSVTSSFHQCMRKKAGKVKKYTF